MSVTASWGAGAPSSVGHPTEPLEGGGLELRRGVTAEAVIRVRSSKRLGVSPG